MLSLHTQFAPRSASASAVACASVENSTSLKIFGDSENSTSFKIIDDSMNFAEAASSSAMASSSAVAATSITLVKKLGVDPSWGDELDSIDDIQIDYMWRLYPKKDDSKLHVRTGGFDFTKKLTRNDFKTTAMLEKTINSTTTENFKDFSKRYKDVECYDSKSMDMIIQLTRLVNFTDFKDKDTINLQDFSDMWKCRSKANKLQGTEIDIEKNFNFEGALQVERVLISTFFKMQDGTSHEDLHYILLTQDEFNVFKETQELTPVSRYPVINLHESPLHALQFGLWLCKFQKEATTGQELQDIYMIGFKPDFNLNVQRSSARPHQVLQSLQR